MTEKSRLSAGKPVRDDSAIRKARKRRKLFECSVSEALPKHMKGDSPCPATENARQLWTSRESAEGVLMDRYFSSNAVISPTKTDIQAIIAVPARSPVISVETSNSPAGLPRPSSDKPELCLLGTDFLASEELDSVKGCTSLRRKERGGKSAITICGLVQDLSNDNNSACFCDSQKSAGNSQDDRSHLNYSSHGGRRRHLLPEDIAFCCTPGSPQWLAGTSVTSELVTEHNPLTGTSRLILQRQITDKTFSVTDAIKVAQKHLRKKSPKWISTSEKENALCLADLKQKTRQGGKLITTKDGSKGQQNSEDLSSSSDSLPALKSPPGKIPREVPFITRDLWSSTSCDSLQRPSITNSVQAPAELAGDVCTRDSLSTQVRNLDQHLLHGSGTKDVMLTVPLNNIDHNVQAVKGGRSVLQHKILPAQNGDLSYQPGTVGSQTSQKHNREILKENTDFSKATISCRQSRRSGRKAREKEATPSGTSPSKAGSLAVEDAAHACHETRGTSAGKKSPMLDVMLATDSSAQGVGHWRNFWQTRGKVLKGTEHDSRIVKTGEEQLRVASADEDRLSGKTTAENYSNVSKSRKKEGDLPRETSPHFNSIPSGKEPPVLDVMLATDSSAQGVGRWRNFWQTRGKVLKGTEHDSRIVKTGEEQLRVASADEDRLSGKTTAENNSNVSKSQKKEGDLPRETSPHFNSIPSGKEPPVSDVLLARVCPAEGVGRWKNFWQNQRKVLKTAEDDSRIVKTAKGQLHMASADEERLAGKTSAENCSNISENKKGGQHFPLEKISNVPLKASSAIDCLQEPLVPKGNLLTSIHHYESEIKGMRVAEDKDLPVVCAAMRNFSHKTPHEGSREVESYQKKEQCTCLDAKLSQVITSPRHTASKQTFQGALQCEPKDAGVQTSFLCLIGSSVKMDREARHQFLSSLYVAEKKVKFMDASMRPADERDPFSFGTYIASPSGVAGIIKLRANCEKPLSVDYVHDMFFFALDDGMMIATFGGAWLLLEKGSVFHLTSGLPYKLKNVGMATCKLFYTLTKSA